MTFQVSGCLDVLPTLQVLESSLDTFSWPLLESLYETVSVFVHGTRTLFSVGRGTAQHLFLCIRLSVAIAAISLMCNSWMGVALSKWRLGPKTCPALRVGNTCSMFQIKMRLLVHCYAVRTVEILGFVEHVRSLMACWGLSFCRFGLLWGMHCPCTCESATHASVATF